MEKNVETALPEKKRGWVFRKRTIFIAVAFAISTYFTLMAFTFPFGSGLYPMVIGFFAVSMSLSELILELRGGGGEFETMDLEVSESQKGAVAMRKALRYLFWMAGIYIGIALVGFNITILAFFILFMKLEGKVPWWKVILLTAIAGIMTLYYFPRILSMEWPTGLLQEIFEDFPL